MEENEDTTHVLQCAHHEAISLWQKSIGDLEVWMTNNYRHPELIELVILGLNTWHSNNLLPLQYDILEPLLKVAYSKQQQLDGLSSLKAFGQLNRE
jgi:hypothetical protein